ncbi:gastrula zinc finger protein XlCGF52.1-like [Sitophilus oryzae]|uniref:Gastrula zinc finger protein XlCGF52.1-like n=1 Tax=Sitophilus oryzae TaxID=7048 RepID=A0A6J2XQ23_SITOR|nr:gastrula zinc finger protein XlCGF52.1-like [Sitophilus oryzae]
MVATRKSPRKRKPTIKFEENDSDSNNISVDFNDIKTEIKDEDYAQNVLEKRKRKYNTKKSWPCKKCAEVFKTMKLLLKHRKVHNEYQENHSFKFDPVQDLFICTTCSAEFQLEEEVKSHIKNKHENEYKCKSCGEAFKTTYDIAYHSAVHDPDRIMTCPLCSYRSPKKGSILIHINYKHLRKFSYTCAKCGKGFNDHLIFEEHENEHLGVKPFVCIVCEKSFTYTRYLYTHQVRTHRAGIDGQLLPNQCMYCNRNYSKPESLEKHMLETHLKTGPHEKKHLCVTCGKGFSQKSKLVIHERIHTGYKPYACGHCTKRFIKKDYLVLHERTHSGEKPFSCEYCGKRFTQGAPLRIHLRTHTGEKPYECTHCKMRFGLSSQLKVHKNCLGVAEYNK